MKSNERTLNILSELVKNSLDAESSEVNVNIKKADDFIEITVQDNGKGMNDETAKEVHAILNQPRKRVYDEYYSGLLGSNHSESGLKNIGYQVDESDVESSPEGTTIRVKRENKTNRK